MAAIDLITIAEVKEYWPVAETQRNLDPLIGNTITRVSGLMLREARRRTFTPKRFTDTLDGNGQFVMAMKDYPILNVESVTINDQVIPAKGTTTSGFVWSPFAVKLINGATSGDTLDPALDSPAYRFFWGQNNVVITYWAGYLTLPTWMVWRGPWDAATAYVLGDAVSNGGKYWQAKTANTNITPVEGATWGEFANDSPELQALKQACIIWVQSILTKRQHIDLSSQGVAGSTTSYLDQVMPKDVQQVLRSEKRWHV